MELYPQHYTRRSKADEGAVDVPLRLVLERLDEVQKMEVRLGDRIEDRCGGLERWVVETEQRAEERFVSLEMARTKAEQGCVEFEKQFDGLKLEVHRMNHLLERESMVKPYGQAGHHWY
jgi:hypothetical protein